MQIEDGRGRLLGGGCRSRCEGIPYFVLVVAAVPVDQQFCLHFRQLKFIARTRLKFSCRFMKLALSRLRHVPNTVVRKSGSNGLILHRNYNVYYSQEINLAIIVWVGLTRKTDFTKTER